MQSILIQKHLFVQFFNFWTTVILLVKADLKTKQVNLDQLKQNLKTAQREVDNKSTEIQQLKNEVDILQNSKKDVMNTEQVRIKIHTLRKYDELTHTC